MHEAKAAGVPTPMIFMVDVPESAITMEYVEGKQVKQLLNGFSKRNGMNYALKSAS